MSVIFALSGQPKKHQPLFQYQHHDERQIGLCGDLSCPKLAIQNQPLSERLLNLSHK